MLEEAVEVIRTLWSGGVRSHRGEHYTLDAARLYSLPDAPPPVLVSGFGPKAIRLAARVGDGFVTTRPSAEHVRLYREAGGQGPVVGACKFCWGPDEKAAVALAHDLWPTEALSGQLSQELPMPAHFDEATALVTPEMVGEALPCGPDPARYIESINGFVEAGFDELFINQIGPDLQGFLRFFESEVRPKLSIS
ncbi:MAG TPA: TIGR03557 family F420-dependent LLM class oxidoreductase [Acidimicrobiales bacterium]|nr:TIGR03557 family F420-dependent LLM class oxidoreductase [Acidimicrobiales bacterium]